MTVLGPKGCRWRSHITLLTRFCRLPTLATDWGGAGLLIISLWGGAIAAPAYGAPFSSPAPAIRYASGSASQPTARLQSRHPDQDSQTEGYAAFFRNRPPTPETSQSIPPSQQAPSVVWLIVMPSIPLVGGAVIYLSRRLWGTSEGESRVVCFQPAEDPCTAEPPPGEAQNLEADVQE